MRNVWLLACGTVAGTPGEAGVKGKARLTSAGALLPAKVFDGAVVQLATHFFFPPPPSFADTAAATSSASSRVFRARAMRGFDMGEVSVWTGWASAAGLTCRSETGSTNTAAIADPAGEIFPKPLSFYA